MSSLSHIALDVIRACQSFGARIPIWTQGAGGNLSCKEGEFIWIKASGARLDSVNESKGLAKVRWKAVLEGMKLSFESETEAEIFYADLLNKSAEKEFGLGHPSMETGFHVQLPSKWVAHFHSLPAVLMAHEYRQSPEEMAQWLKTHFEGKVSLLPALRPGWLLSKAVFDNRESRVLILENHGIILQSQESLEVGQGLLAQWERIEKIFCENFGYFPSPVESCPLKVYLPDTAVFYSRLKACLTLDNPDAETYRMGPEAQENDRDMAEIWNSIRWLYGICPRLPELPQGISSQVAALPTERMRTNSPPLSVSVEA